MIVDLAKELHPEESIETHKEQEKDGDIVNLLAGPLEDLVDPGLWHGELQEHPDEPANHNQTFPSMYVIRLKRLNLPDHDQGPGAS